MSRAGGDGKPPAASSQGTAKVFMSWHPACRPQRQRRNSSAACGNPMSDLFLQPTGAYGAARRRVAVSYRMFFKRPQQDTSAAKRTGDVTTAAARPQPLQASELRRVVDP